MSASVTHLLANPGTLCDLLCIDVGAERFAMPLSSVEEMVDGCGVVFTANVVYRHRHLVGVIRVRDVLLPVFDAAGVLNVERTSAEPMALVLQGPEQRLVLLVDGAEAVSQVNLADVRTPERLMSIDSVLDGVLFVNGRWVSLVNTAALVEALERDSGERFPEASHD